MSEPSPKADTRTEDQRRDAMLLRALKTPPMPRTKILPAAKPESAPNSTDR